MRSVFAVRGSSPNCFRNLASNLLLKDIEHTTGKALCHHTFVLHHVDVEHLRGINKYLHHHVVLLYHFDIKHIMKQHDQKCGISNMLLKYLKAD